VPVLHPTCNQTTVDEHVDDISFELDKNRWKCVTAKIRRPLRGGQLQTAGHRPERVDVETRIDLVENAQRRLDDPSCTISVRFFSPPERSTLRGRVKRLDSSPTPGLVGQSLVERVGPDAAGGGVEEVAQSDPGDLDGVLERQEHARTGPLPGRPTHQLLAVEGDAALVTVVPGLPISAWVSVLLPEPLDP